MRKLKAHTHRGILRSALDLCVGWLHRPARSRPRQPKPARLQFDLLEDRTVKWVP